MREREKIFIKKSFLKKYSNFCSKYNIEGKP
jgi:hypothetical protein